MAGPGQALVRSGGGAQRPVPPGRHGEGKNKRAAKVIAYPLRPAALATYSASSTSLATAQGTRPSSRLICLEAFSRYILSQLITFAPRVRGIGIIVLAAHECSLDLHKEVLRLRQQVGICRFAENGL